MQYRQCLTTWGYLTYPQMWKNVYTYFSVTFVPAVLQNNSPARNIVKILLILRNLGTLIGLLAAKNQ